MQADNNSRDELIQRFRDDLNKPLSERFYSEEELLSIFDVAGDNYDDYIRMEALMLGMRLYPDSKELLARRAIFYRDNDPVSFKNFLKDNNSVTDTQMLSIIRMAGQKLSREETVEQLEAFLAGARFDEDEDVIQFVRTVHSINADKWLVDNLDRIKAKVSYLPSLLYEIAILSDESEEYASIAIAVLEELTELEPYTPEYWTLLSLLYTRDNRKEDAINAVEYALAIDPENLDALKAKLRSISDEDPTSPEIINLLDRIGTLDPMDAEFAHIRLMHAEEIDDTDKVRSLIDSFPISVAAYRPIFIKAIQYGSDNFEKMAETLYDLNVAEEADWNELAELAFAAKNFTALTTLIQVYEKKSGHSLDHSYIDLRMLYEMGKYDMALTLFTDENASGALRNPDNFMHCYTIYVMSLLRTGYIPEAADACDTMLKLIEDEPMLPGSKLEKFGMKSFLNDVKKRIKSVRKTNWSKYDPLAIDLE